MPLTALVSWSSEIGRAIGGKFLLPAYLQDGRKREQFSSERKEIGPFTQRMTLPQVRFDYLRSRNSHFNENPYDSTLRLFHRQLDRHFLWKRHHSQCAIYTTIVHLNIILCRAISP